MSMFATPRTANTRSDELGKDDILDQLAVFEVIDYDPETNTKYGTSPTITCQVTVIDGDHAGRVEPDFYAAGNLARQIGEALDAGQMAPGRIIKGTSANGRSWYGINWTSDSSDLRRAENALHPTPKPTLGQQTQAATRDIRATTKRQATAAADSDAPF